MIAKSENRIRYTGKSLLIAGAETGSAFPGFADLVFPIVAATTRNGMDSVLDSTYLPETGSNTTRGTEGIIKRPAVLGEKGMVNIFLPVIGATSLFNSSLLSGSNVSMPSGHFSSGLLITGRLPLPVITILRMA